MWSVLLVKFSSRYSANYQLRGLETKPMIAWVWLTVPAIKISTYNLDFFVVAKITQQLAVCHTFQYQHYDVISAKSRRDCIFTCSKWKTLKPIFRNLRTSCLVCLSDTRAGRYDRAYRLNLTQMKCSRNVTVGLEGQNCTIVFCEFWGFCIILYSICNKHNRIKRIDYNIVDIHLIKQLL